MHSIVSDKSHLPLGFSDARSKVAAARGSMSPAPPLHTTKTTYAPNTVDKPEQGQAISTNRYRTSRIFLWSWIIISSSSKFVFAL